MLVRRERPHHGARLSLFDQDEGLRHQMFLTDTPYSGQPAVQRPHGEGRGRARQARRLSAQRLPDVGAGLASVGNRLSVPQVHCRPGA
ncbi:hypothetical protein CG723_39080 [Streptomyces sp. CB01635]|nr:hypothetical protein CG723_39080 [Streptomyces sp. CB01635]